ncbi:hypothetical protein ABIB50_002558 [Mucilaginibacter sp. UYCu711]
MLFQMYLLTGQVDATLFYNTDTISSTVNVFYINVLYISLNSLFGASHTGHE